MRRTLMAAVLCGTVLALAGCATPARRIQQNPQLFASFPAEVQQNVRQGRIELGYTQDMVLIALGQPDRVYARASVGHTNAVWSYVSARLATDYRPMSAPVVLRDSRGRLRVVDELGWYDMRREQEYERLRVELESDKVVAVEHLKE